MTSHAPPTPRSLAVFGSACTLFLALLTQPYWGLGRDGVLYLGQVLHHLHPAGLSADVFFAHGSQDRYSIYSTVMAPLYQHVPLDVLQMVGVILATGATLAAVYQLLRELSPTGAWMGVFCVAALNHNYGGNGVFTIAEEFLTARTLAEPLVLWGLVFFQRGAFWAAGVSLLTAAAFHPLMTIPAVVIIWLALQAWEWRWRFALTLIALTLALAMAGIAPFDALLQRYDDAWWRLVREVNTQSLLSQWICVDWQQTLVDATLLGLAGWRFAPPRLATLCRASGLAALMLVAASALGSDLAHNRLVTELQLWRVLWIVHVLALACVPLVLAGLWTWETSFGIARLAAALVANAVVTAGAGWVNGWAMLLAAALAIAAAYYRVQLSRPVTCLAMGGALLCMLGISAADAWSAHTIWRSGYAAPLLSPPWVLLLGEPPVCLPLALGALRVWQGEAATHGRARRAAMSLGLGLLLLAVAPQWDRRGDWVRLLEHATLNRPHPFDTLIPPGSQLYWQDEFAAPWLLLDRPNYYSRGLGAGLLFNEGTAREFGPRWDQLKSLDAAMYRCRVMSDVSRQPEAQCITPAEETVRSLCRAQPHPDYLIFSAALRPSALAAWDPQLPSWPALRFYLYACTQFR